MVSDGDRGRNGVAIGFSFGFTFGKVGCQQLQMFGIRENVWIIKNHSQSEIKRVH